MNIAVPPRLLRPAAACRDRWGVHFAALERFNCLDDRRFLPVSAPSVLPLFQMGGLLRFSRSLQIQGGLPYREVANG